MALLIGEGEADDDIAAQPTLLMPAIRLPLVLIVVCQFCLLEWQARQDFPRWDARREPLGICQFHLERLSQMSSDDYEAAMDAQYMAVWRWMHPFDYGEQ